MLPLELSADACSLRPGEVRRVVSVEVRIGADGTPGRAARSPRADPQPGAADLRRGARSAVGRRQHPNGELLARADDLARDLRARRQARGAFALAARELSFEIADGRVARCALGRGAARTRARRGAHAARERGRRRPARAGPAARALPRARASEARGAAAAGRSPDGARPAGRSAAGASDGPAASRCVARQAELLAPLLRERPDDARGLRHAAAAHARARALRPGQHRPRRAGLAGLRAFHVADPPLSRHRGAPRGLRAGGTGRGRARRRASCRSSRCAARGASARRPTPSAVPTRSAWPSCCGTACAATAGTQTFDGVVTGLIGAGLFVRFGDVFEGFLPARRLDPARALRQRRARRGARRTRSSGRRIRLGDELSCVVTGGRPAARSGDARHRARGRRRARASTRRPSARRRAARPSSRSARRPGARRP